MTKYRIKNAYVEAKQWFKLRDVDGVRIPSPGWRIDPAFQCGESKNLCTDCKNPLAKHGEIQISQDLEIVCPGDWIVNKLTGELSIYKPEEFEERYKKTGKLRTFISHFIS